MAAASGRRGFGCAVGGSKVTEATTSASSVTEPSATGSALDRLAGLIERAEESSALATTNQRNRELLKDLCFALVALAQLVATQQAQAADKPRIIVP